MRLLASKQINLTSQKIAIGESFDVEERMGKALVALGSATIVKETAQVVEEVAETNALDLGTIEKRTEQ